MFYGFKWLKFIVEYIFYFYGFLDIYWKVLKVKMSPWFFIQKYILFLKWFLEGG